ncbi:MAG: energy transducer TonB [Flavobacteriales bacterium]|nr:energy transducer TonB [Bacteroidota bacterium]MCB9240761.1 energy transducer TonB [Flavobacteriales bacterium]
MRRGINKHRYRNFCIGMSMACAFVLWAFNIERVKTESEVEIIYSPIDAGVEITSWIPEPEPEPEPEPKKQEPPVEPTPEPNPFNFKLIHDFTPIEPVVHLKTIPTQLTKHTLPTVKKIEPSPIEINPDQLASYPGGEDELRKFLERSVNYPDLCYEMGLDGRVVIRFIVDEEGNISNAEVIKDEVGCGAAAEEALRVLKRMPKWQPGLKHGEPVKSYFIQSFSFRIF